MNIKLRSLIGIFTVLDGKICLLTKDSKLISVECNDNLEKINRKYIFENVSKEKIKLSQCYTFSEKQDDLVISVLYVSIVHIESLNNIDDNFKFVPISDIKSGNIYIDKAIETVKNEIFLNSSIKTLFPAHFKLPDIQSVYEQILNKPIDRRNFRKKLLKLNIIEDCGIMSSSKFGRPAKLYKFK